MITLRLDAVEHFARLARTQHFKALSHDLAELRLADDLVNLVLQFVFRLAPVKVAEVLRDRLIKDDAAGARLDETCLAFPVHFAGHADMNRRLNLDVVRVIRQECFIRRSKGAAVALGARL